MSFHIRQWFNSYNQDFFPLYIFLFCKLNFIFRTVFAVYEMVGSPVDMFNAEELFNKLDQNSDGSISQEDFISIIKQDQDLLNVLQNTAWNGDIFEKISCDQAKQRNKVDSMNVFYKTSACFASSANSEVIKITTI